MSTMNAFRREISRLEPSMRRSVPLLLALVLGIVLTAGWLANRGVLSDPAPDDFGSVLFQPG